MGYITAKQLKNHTGECIKRIKAGENLMLTCRGKPIAEIAPITENKTKSASFKESWNDIESALNKSKKHFKNWQEAMHWVRGRN